MTVSSHLRVIWRARLRIIVAAAIVAGIVLVYSLTVPRVYAATAQLAVSLPTTQSQTPGEQDVLFYANTFAALGKTVPVLSDAARSSKLHIDETVAASRIKVAASSTVGIITVTAQGASPGAATTLARAATDSLVRAVTTQATAAIKAAVTPLLSQVQSLQNQLQSLQSGSTEASAAQAQIQSLLQAVAQSQAQETAQVSVVSPSRAQPGVVSPKTTTSALLAFVAALVVVSELVALLDYRADRFREDGLDDDLHNLLALPVLGRIPRAGRTARVEAFRALRTNLAVTPGRADRRAVAVVAVSEGADGADVAINLALRLAETGAPTALVDADLHQPKIAGRLGLASIPGLSDVLAGAPLTGCLQGVADAPSLRLLAAGAPPEDPGRLLDDRVGNMVLSPLCSNQFVLVNTPSDHPCADAVAIGSQCDATLIVIELGRTRRREARETVDRLTLADANPIGVVVGGFHAPRRFGLRRHRGGLPNLRRDSEPGQGWIHAPTSQPVPDAIAAGARRSKVVHAPPSRVNGSAT